MRKSNWRTQRRARVSAIGRKRGLASQRVQRDSRLTREVDADTLRRRALADAREQTLRVGCTYRASGITHWQVTRSRFGRTNQRDLIVNGEVFRTCGPRRLPAWLR